MKIVSKFHDFYDSCLAFGHDDHVVYLRDHLVFLARKQDNEVPPIIRDLRMVFGKLRARSQSLNHWTDWMGGFGLPNSITGKDYRIYLGAVHILFCGKHYPAIKCATEPRGGLAVRQEDYFYSAADLIKHLEKHGVTDHKDNKYSKHSAFARIQKWFNEQIQPDVEWLVANKVTCVVMDAAGDISVNPPLRNYQFFRRLDAYTAYQELDMWISGTLAYPQNMMIEVEDKYRIMAHGFDMKYGFRTRPKN